MTSQMLYGGDYFKQLSIFKYGWLKRHLTIYEINQLQMNLEQRTLV